MARCTPAMRAALVHDPVPIGLIGPALPVRGHVDVTNTRRRRHAIAVISQGEKHQHDQPRRPLKRCFRRTAGWSLLSTGERPVEKRRTASVGRLGVRGGNAGDGSYRLVDRTPRDHLLDLVGCGPA